MKRTIEEETQNIASMARCLMLLSQTGSCDYDKQSNTSSNRVFTCNTCNREFSSFQALGGHRASHKKPKLMKGDKGYDHLKGELVMKPKTHECSICGLEFAIGQALGGHMRKHRGSMAKTSSPCSSSPSSSLTQLPSSPLTQLPSSPLMQLPVINRSNSRRVLCLDLNLSPPDSDFGFSFQKCYEEKSSPVFHCFI